MHARGEHWIVIGFDEDSAIWRAPGVLPLMGEFRGDTEGYSLTFGLSMGCLTSVMLLDDPVIEIVSEQGDDPLEIKVSKVSPKLAASKPEWARPVLSVLALLAESGTTLRGMSITIDSDIAPGPDFAGAAAVRCSTAAAVSELCGKPLALADVVRIARRAKVPPDEPSAAEQTGVFCWPDQVVLSRGPDAAVEELPFELEADNLTILVCDTGVRVAADAPSELARRAACAEAARLIGVSALHELTLDDLEDALDRLPNDELRRLASHVVGENDRVLACAELIGTEQIRRIGSLMNASHESQRDDFGVSFAEAELAVSIMKAFGAAGARLVGRGGEVIGLMDPSQARAATIALDGSFGGRGYATPALFTVFSGRGLHKR